MSEGAGSGALVERPTMLARIAHAVMAQNWAAVVVEILIVVVGVLLALAADSWVDERSDRAEERAVLIGLLADYKTNRNRLDELVEFHRNAINSAQSLLALTGPEPESADPGVVDALVVGFMTWELYAPVEGRLNALLSSGRIGVLRNNDLQAALAGWAAVLEDVRENERYAVDLQLHVFVPYLVEHFAIRTLDHRTGMTFATSPSSFTPDYMSILADKRFENIVADRMANTTFLIEDAGRLRQYIEEIIRLIEVELGSA